VADTITLYRFASLGSAFVKICTLELAPGTRPKVGPQQGHFRTEDPYWCVTAVAMILMPTCQDGFCMPSSPYSLNVGQIGFERMCLRHLYP
jgi:hypothetical protein